MQLVCTSLRFGTHLSELKRNPIKVQSGMELHLATTAEAESKRPLTHARPQDLAALGTDGIMMPWSWARFKIGLWSP